MFKLMRVFVFCWIMLIIAGPVMAQGVGAEGADVETEDVDGETEGAQAAVVAAAPAPWSPVIATSALGAGLVIIGASLGIARIGGQAVDGIARQPEAAGNIQTAMIISAALIEGATFFALIVCMLFNK